MNVATIEAAILEWIRAASGLNDQHVIMSHQDCTDPSGLYITLDLEDADTLGMFPEQYFNSSGLMAERAHWRFEASIEAWRSGAYQLLITTKSKMLLGSVYQILQDAGISADLRVVQSLPSLRGGQWEDHAKLSVVFHHGEVATADPDIGEDPVGYFTAITYEGPEMDPHPISETTIDP